MIEVYVAYALKRDADAEARRLRTLAPTAASGFWWIEFTEKRVRADSGAVALVRGGVVAASIAVSEKIDIVCRSRGRFSCRITEEDPRSPDDPLEAAKRALRRAGVAFLEHADNRNFRFHLTFEWTGRIDVDLIGNFDSSTLRWDAFDSTSTQPEPAAIRLVCE